MSTAAGKRGATPSWAVPLRERLRGSEVRRFRRLATLRDHRLRRTLWRVAAAASTVVVASAAVVVVVVVCGVMLLIGVAAAAGQASGVDGGWRVLAGALAIVDALVACVFVQAVVDIVRRDVPAPGRWRRAARLARFASWNDLTHTMEVRDPPALGLLFAAGTRRRTTDLIQGDDGLGFLIGNHQYAGLGLERRLRRFGFLGVGLPRRLPHMVLQSELNRRSFRRPSLPWRLTGNERLPLGEEFDRSFTLYCPERYAPDAHYVFTPKVMRLLLESAKGFDVEIVDDRMLLSTPRPFRMTDPATYELLGMLQATIGSGVAQRAQLYRDPRALRPGRVGPYGRRLELRLPASTLVLGAVFGALAVMRIITALLGIGV